MFPDSILKDSTGRPSPSTLWSCIYRKQHLLPMLLIFSEREKEFDDSTEHFDEGSYRMLQELENLLNS